MIRSLDESGRMVQAYLGVEKRSDKAAGKTRHYVVPKLTVGQSPQELQSGEASVASISASGIMALPSVSDEVSQMIRDDAVEFGIDEDLFYDSVMATTGGDVARIDTMHIKLHAGAIVPVVQDGSIKWIKK